MGLNSYMCAYCGDNIRKGEGAILFHVRGGNILGKSIGWQDGYGRVNGTEELFKLDDSPNSHNEIMKSRFGLDDSGARSGISALHVPCFRKALKRNPKLLSALLISEGDNNQGLGKSRKKYSSLDDVIKLRDDIEEIASTSL